VSRVTPKGLGGSGLLVMVVKAGLTSGIIFGLFAYGLSGSGASAVAAGVLAGLLFSATVMFYAWRNWRGNGDLTFDERAAVARKVSRGEHVTDPRLARAVLEQVSLIRRTQERDQRNFWVLRLVSGANVLLAVVLTASGSMRLAIMWWLIVILGVVSEVARPRRRDRIAMNAARSEDSARRLLGLNSPSEGEARG
jgi:hypothetical protein